MARPHGFWRGGSSRSVALIAAIGAIGLGGCDTQDDVDTERGRELFLAECGRCHTLAEAGSTSEIGPDLDAAFAEARDTGMDEDTIEGVVQQQIDSPRTIDEDAPNFDEVYMPADLVTGEDAEQVSEYVASVAGVPGIEPPRARGGPGGQVFAEFGCGTCHAMEAAESTGTTGPNLDDTLEGASAKYIEQQIVDPDSDIVANFSAGVMPGDYEQVIPPEDLELLVAFLFEETSGGK